MTTIRAKLMRGGRDGDVIDVITVLDGTAPQKLTLDTFLGRKGIYTRVKQEAPGLWRYAFSDYWDGNMGRVNEPQNETPEKK